MKSRTFANLPEGATLTMNGYVLGISYNGGDGNDVVLTVRAVPNVPQTGMHLIFANPVGVLAITTILALGILLIAKKQKDKTRRI